MTTPDLTIRAAVPGDLLSLLDLYGELSDFHAALDSRFVEGRTAQKQGEKRFREWLTNPRSIVLLAEKTPHPLAPSPARDEGEKPLWGEREAVGFGVGFLFEPGPGTVQVRSGMLAELGVTAAYRQQGIGEQITRELLAWFRSRGVARVYVGAAVRNPIATNFWRKMGFEDFVTLRTLDLGPMEEEIA